MAAGLTHEHLLVRSDDDRCAGIVDEVERSLDAGDHVLVCLPADHWEPARRRLGVAADHVRFVPGGDRYARPTVAMGMLGDFVDEAAGLGRRACSIGALSFVGTSADTPWLRYEAAVNEVFAGAALHAVCLTDVRTTPADVVDALALLHDHADHDEATDDARRRLLRDLPSLGQVPARPADVVAEVASDARRGIRAHVTPFVGDELGDDLELVVTELLGNTTRHVGTGMACIWREADRVVVAVTDAGDGIDDLAAGYRRSGEEEGGRGLWLVRQLSTTMDFVVDGEGHTVVTTHALAG